MTPCPQPTDFAPAERADQQTLSSQAALLAGKGFAPVLHAVGAILFVLNAHRQIVFANAMAQKVLGDIPMNSILGARPGEALLCIHADRHDGGCGTTRWCRACGSTKAILSSLNGQADVEECRITRMMGGRKESLDLLVNSRPMSLDGQPFTVFTLQDISHEKRRQALERVFFHDLLNVAGGLSNLVEEFSRRLKETEPKVAVILERGFNQMVDEIQSQKTLAAAENGELTCHLESVDSLFLLGSVAELYRRHKVAQQRGVAVDPEAKGLRLRTDITLLLRVMGNLVKNALEASDKEQTVTLGCRSREGGVRFWVHNHKFMPPEVQRQIFQRSFSTKGLGRGLGTYGVQLLTENFLGGEVSFESAPELGTFFYVDLPLGGCDGPS